MNTEVIIIEGSISSRGGLRAIVKAVVDGLESLGASPARVTFTRGCPGEAEAAVEEAMSRARALIVIDSTDSFELSSLGEPRPLETDQCPESGAALAVEGTDIYFLPASRPAAEALLEARVLPELVEAGLCPRPRKTLSFATFGLSLEEARARLVGLSGGDADLELEVHDRFPEVEVVLTARATSRKEAEARVRSLGLQVIGHLDPFLVHGLEGETLAEAAASALGAVGATVAVAESLAPGLVARRLSAASRASAPLLLGIAAPGDQVQTELLGVPRELIAEAGPVSAEVTRATAEGLAGLSGATVALATAGISGPSSGGPDKPLGLVHFALVAEDGARTEEMRLGPMARWRIEELAAAHAFAMLIRWAREVRR